MANIVPPSFLTPDQLTAFREILEAKNFALESAVETSTKGFYADVLSSEYLEFPHYNAPAISQYTRIPNPDGYGDLITPLINSDGTNIDAGEIGAARAMLRYRDIPMRGKRIGPLGDVYDPRNPSFEELMASGESGDRTHTRAIQYIASSNPESIDLNLLRSYIGTPEENLALFTKEQSNLVSRDWWAGRPLIPSQYDPRAWESRVRGLEPRLMHFEALDKKLRGVATQKDLDNIYYSDSVGHSDLSHNVPTTSTEALNEYYRENRMRDDFLNAATFRRNQFNRQIAVGAKKLEDPVFKGKLEGVSQAFRDALKYLNWTTPNSHWSEAPSGDYMGSYPDLSRHGESELARLRAGMPTFVLEDAASDAWNFMKPANQMGAFPAIEAMVGYNNYIKGTNLSAGLMEAASLGGENLSMSVTKGGYLGSNFAPQLEQIFDDAVIRDKNLMPNARGIANKYQSNPNFRSAVNKFIPNTLRTPAAGAVGGVLSMTGQVIDATDSDYMNRNYRGTDPFAIRPFYDLLLAPSSGQSYSDAGRAYETMVSSPEYIQRNPLSSMIGQAVRGDNQYLKAFAEAYIPDFSK